QAPQARAAPGTTEPSMPEAGGGTRRGARAAPNWPKPSTQELENQSRGRASMPGVLRLIVFLFPAVITAAACVPSEDKSTSGDGQATPTTSARPMTSPRLNPQRPILPNANPGAEAAAPIEPVVA